MSQQGKRQAKAKKDALTPKQWAFVYAFVECLNRTEAAARAEYQGDRATLAAIGSENLRKPKIRAAVDALLNERTLGAHEVLSRLSDQALGLPADCFVVDAFGRVAVDFATVQARGLLHLIKKVEYTARREPGGDDILETCKVEVYDAQAALVHIGKYHKLFVERQEHSGPNGGPIAAEVSIDLSKLSNEQLQALADSLEE